MKTMIGVCKSRTLLNTFGVALLMLFALTMSKTAFAAENACCGLSNWEEAKQSCYTQHWVPGAYGVQGHYETIPCYGNKPVVEDDYGPYYHKHCYYTKKHHKKCYYHRHYSHRPWYNNYYHRSAVTLPPQASVSQPTVYKQ